MSIFDDTDEQDDLSIAIRLLSKLSQFADEQSKRGLIDGACDPDIYVSLATDLISKYGTDDTDLDNFALQA